jgi:basic amino acid/polyamine antiporter, APA family
VSASGEPGTQGSLSVGTLFALAIGTIIGVGWITLLGDWLRDAGSLGAAAAFLIGGLAMLPIAFCYAEASATIDGSGGEIAFGRSFGGEYWAFAAGWLLLFVFLAVIAFQALSIAWIVDAMVPTERPAVAWRLLSSDVTVKSLVIGSGAALMMAAIHLTGRNLIGWLQNLTTYVKLAIAVLFIGAGIAFGSTANLAPSFQAGAVSGSYVGFLSVLVITPMFYSGFNTLTQAVGERAAGISLRSAGMALVLSIVVAILFYCGVIWSASLAAPLSVIMRSDLPAAAAFEAAFGSPAFGRVVLAAGLLGLVSAWNATFFAATRVLARFAEEGILPAVLARRDARGGLPAAVVLCTALTLAGVIGGRGLIGPIVSGASICLIVLFMITAWSIRDLRRRQPAMTRTFSVPGGQATITLALCLSALLLVTAAAEQLLRDGPALELLALTLWALAGIIVLRRRRDRGAEGATA